MIPTKELRLGNYVKDCKNGFPMYVCALGSDWVYLDCNVNEGDLWGCKDKDLEPVPITYELLAILGFTQCKTDYWNKPYYEKDNIKIVRWDNDFWCVFVDKDINNRISLIIESLHELQNAYFSINQKELEVNL